MSDFSISIHLDNKKEVYHPGDELSGTVLFTSKKRLKCQMISLKLIEQTGLKSWSFIKDIEELVLFEGRLPKEETFPFSIILPEGPYSYDGKLLTIKWSLSARMTLPGSSFTECEERVSLEVQPDSHSKTNLLYIEHKSQMDEAQESSDRDFLRFSAYFLAAGFPLVWIAKISRSYEYNSVLGIPNDLFFWFGFILVYLGTFMGIVPFWRLVIEIIMGKVSLLIKPSVVSPGDTFLLEVGVFPKLPLSVLSCRAEFRGYEKYESSMRDKIKKGPHYIVQEDFLFEQVDPESEGEPLLWRVEKEMPSDAPFSFAGRESFFRWDILIVVQMYGWGLWRKTYPLAVVPRGAKEQVEALLDEDA